MLDRSVRETHLQTRLLDRQVYWNRQAAAYDALYTRRYSRLEDRFVEAVLSASFGSVQGTVLDVGCGTGLGLDLLPRHLHYVGLDLSEAMLARARAKHNGRARFVRHDVEQRLPFERAAFDGLLALFTTFSYFMNPRQAAAEFSRVLKPDAPLVVMALGCKALWRRGDHSKTGVYRTRRSPDAAYGVPARFYTAHELANLCAPYFTAQVEGLSAFGNFCEWSWLWLLDRLLCRLYPDRAHSLIVKGHNRHA